MDDYTRRPTPDGEMTIVVGHDALRRTAQDWRRYSSDTPFRVPIPEESDLRPVRQYPIETDPPAHTMYRSLIAARFGRSAADSIRPTIAGLVDAIVTAGEQRGLLGVVDELAIPVVTTAIAETLGRPGDAARFASWGLHVFRDPVDGHRRRNDDLDAYLAERVDASLADPGDDLMGDLAAARPDGRALTRDELLGYGYLVLAGGRDTVIAAIAGSLWHLSERAGERAVLAAHPERIGAAVEELLRYFSPLGYIGRTVTETHDSNGVQLTHGERIALGFAAANHDPRTFDRPDEIRLDRRPNRHVAFGHGPHTCIGAPLARMQLAAVLERFVRVGSATVVSPTGWRPGAARATSTIARIPLDLTLALAPPSGGTTGRVR